MVSNSSVYHLHYKQYTRLCVYHDNTPHIYSSKLASLTRISYTQVTSYTTFGS